MEKKYIATNEKGYRIGQDHPNAKLTDIEVAALIRDRGPEDAPTMSLSQLAKRYGLSKSGVKGIIDGHRRGQAQRLVKKSYAPKKKAPKENRVVAGYKISLRARTLIRKAGGSAAIERIASSMETSLGLARSDDAEGALERVLKRIAKR